LTVEFSKNRDKFSLGEGKIMKNSTSSQLLLASRDHPRLFSAIWFTLATLLLSSPLIAVTFLLLITQFFPLASIIPFLLSSVLLPLISTFPVGALIGHRIIALPTGKTIHAAVYGLLTGFASFILWIVILEVIPEITGLNLSGNSGGDLPGAAVVVAYLVVLPGIIFSVMITGALAGVLLYKSVSER
jgi:hypothetical protein